MIYHYEVVTRSTTSDITTKLKELGEKGYRVVGVVPADGSLDALVIVEKAIP